MTDLCNCPDYWTRTYQQDHAPECAATPLTLNSRALLDKAIHSRTQEVTITAQALTFLLPAIEAEAAHRALAIQARKSLPVHPSYLDTLMKPNEY